MKKTTHLTSNINCYFSRPFSNPLFTMNKLMKIFIFGLFLFLNIGNSYGQYLETFSIPNRGVIVGTCAGSEASCTTDYTGVDWIINGDFSGMDSNDFFSTDGSDRLNADGDCDAAAPGICFETPVLDISTAGAVSFSIGLDWVSWDVADICNVESQLDGGVWVPVGPLGGTSGPGTVQFNSDGNTGSGVATGSGLTGSTLSLRVCIISNSSFDDIFIDNVSVPESGVMVQSSVTFTAPADLCENAGVQNNLGGGMPTGGVYSGMGVTDDGNGMTYDFDPATAGVGTHTITYTQGGNSAMDDVEVFALPVVTFTAPADLCVDAGVQMGLGGGMPAGGTYSGTGVTDNGGTYDFDPATAGVGVHTITYDFTDTNGCSGSASDMVEVFALPNVTFTAPADLCVNAGVQSGLSGGMPTGGTYGGPGVTDNGGTYDFDPATAGIGIHTITYDFTDINGCSGSASDMVEVFALPSVTFTAPADLCIDAGVQSGLSGGMPAGGTYSGPGVTDNGGTYDFDPAGAGAGVHTITYSFTSGNGCVGMASDMVEVFALPMVTIMVPMNVCITAGVMTFGGGMPVGGMYSGPGVTDNGNGMDYDFDPLVAGLGMHTITYDFTDVNGCSASAMGDVTVTPPIPVSLTIPPAQDTLCVDAGLQVIANAGSPAGGAYSGPGVTDDGNGMSFTFDPLAAGPGLHLITYTVMGMGCSGMFTDFIHVFALPIVTFSIPADQDSFCVDAPAELIAISGNPPGGIYSGSGVTDSGNGTSFTFDPASAGVGFHILTYTFTDNIGCINSFDDFIQVFALPVVMFTAPADLCVDAGVQSGLGGGTPPEGTIVGDMGIYSGMGVTDDGNGMTYSFDPAAAGVGVHTLTYTYTDDEGCSNSASDDVEVYALPPVMFTAPADLCIDAGVQMGLGGGTPPQGTATGDMGVYSGMGVTDNGNGMDYDFDPMAAGLGTHTITYTYTDGNGCTNSASDDVEVFDLPVVTFTALADLCIDAGVQTSLGSGSPTGGVYSGPGVTDDGNGMTYSFDPMGAGAGVHTITYTFTDGNSCTNSANDDVEVFDLPVVTFMALADLCIDAGVQSGLGSGSPTGGIYSGPGVTDDGNGMTYSFDPMGAGVGVHTITYTFTDGNNCTNSASDDVEVFDLPVVTFTALADLCIDAGVQSGLGSGSPTGGIYSGPGVTDDGNGMTYSFDPMGAGAGVHTITYTFTDGNSCTNSASDDVEVFDLPIVTFTALADLCIDAGVQAAQGGGTPTGGIYSGPGVTDNSNGTDYDFDPATAGVGVHTITYTYTDGNGCTDSASDAVEVFGLPVVTFTALADLCIDAGVQAAQGGGSPIGGVYSGDGVTDNSNGMDYDFDPMVAGVGTHTITYTYTDGNGCENSASDDVEVFDLPVVTFTALADLCIDAGVQSGLGSGSPTGGIYSGSGVTDDGNGMTYSFDPMGAGAGVHTITYTFTDGNSCTNSASDDVEVFDLPIVTFTALADLCIDAGVQAAQGGGTPTGGIYSGPGVTDNSNGTDYDFDPATAGVGVHTITYTYTDGNGCTDSASDAVEVFGLPVVTFTALADLCIDAGVQAAQGGGSPIGGVYSGDGVTDNSNGMDYDFDPMVAGVGTHTITYTYTDGNGCENSASDDVEVFDLPVVTFTALADVCIDAGVQSGLGSGSPTGGIYSGPGVTDDGNGMTYSFDPMGAGVGVHTITYTFTDGNSCTNSASDDVEVFDLPIVTFTALADLCIDAGVQAAQGGGTPTGGTYSGAGVTDNGNGMDYDFDPMTAGVGVHTITYTYTDGNGCTNSASDDVEVFDLPVVTFMALADLCIDAGVQSGLGSGSPTGGMYSGPGVTDDGNGMTYSFDPMGAGVGVHTITYTFTDGNSCTNSASDDVEVFDLPVVMFTTLADLCIDAGVQSGLGSGSPTGGIYSGSGVTDDGNGMTYSFDPMGAGAGVHTITYTFTDGNSCTNSASDDVEVFDLPIVTFTALADLCIDAGVQAAQGGGTPTGGIYSGPGVTDNGNGTDYDFDPATAGVGVHTITYTYTDGNGCTDSASDAVEVFGLPVVTFTALADLCIDAGVQAAQGSGSPIGGVYSGDGVTDNSNGMDYDFDPMVAGVGTHTITYTYTDGNGCENSASDDVEVFALPVVMFTTPADLCVDAGVQSGLGGGTPAQGTATGDMGVYSGTGVTDDGNGMTYSFDPMGAGVGTHTITYTYTDGNGCTNSANDDVEVFDLPTVSFTAPSDLCIDAGVQSGLSGGTPAQGTATGDMGVYSGTGVTDDGNGMTYSFDPMGAGVGVHTIAYTYTDENGCTASSSDDVEVFALPVVTFTALPDICINEGIQMGLGDGTPTGGVYSGPGVTDDGNGMTYSFDPEVATAGTHTLTYTFTDGNGCTNSASDDVEVFGESIVTFTALADLCIDAGVQTGLSGGAPPGGIYSGTGVTDDGNGMTYSFDPTGAGVGVHTITYTFTDINGCMTTAMDDVEVFDLPVVTFTAPADLCINDGIQAGLGGGTPTGGIYSGIGVTDDGNGMTYSFDPTVGGAGVYTITYTFTDGNGCTNSASDDVEVFGLSILTFTALADLCIDAGVQSSLGGATPIGGAYSGTGVTDDGNGMTYSFDPAGAGAGVHTLTYTFTDVNGCTNTIDDDVEVFDLPVLTFTALADICIDAGVQAGLGGGTPTGGVYSGTGVTDDGNGMTYSFDPAGAGAGVHTLTYTFTDVNGCTNTIDDDVEVFDLPSISFTALADLCIDAGVQTGLGSGVPPGGVYSGTGVTDDGNGTTYSFDPAGAGVGVHTITYSYNDTNGCTGTFSDDVEVFDLPVVTFTALADVCIDAGVQSGLGSGSPTGGMYSGPGVTDDGNGMTYSFDPMGAGAGVHTITYTFTDGNSCTDSASDDVEVFDLPVVTFTALADVCIDAGVQSGLGSGSPTGGMYSGPGVTDDGNGMTYSFDPMGAGAGVHTITYTFTDGNSCTNSASDDVEVFDLPVVTFTALADLCIDAGVQSGLGSGSPTGGIYSGTGVTDDGNGMTYSFDPMGAGAGVHTITYTFTDGNSCTNSASDDVEVFDLPVVTFTALADVCIDAGVQSGLGSGSPTGGIYSGAGVTDDGNGMTYSFDPMVAGAGVHTITYTFTDGNSCTNSASDDVEVFDLPVVTFTALADVCIDAGVQSGLGSGSPTGGIYSGPGVTDDGNGMTYSFDPAGVGAGVHTITYTFTDGNNCTNSASDDVEVFDLPTVTFTALADLCIDAGVQTGLGNGVPPGGVYSGTGVTDDGNGTTYSFDPASAGVGVHTITYTYNDTNGCTGTFSDDVEVFDLPVVTFTAPSDLCINEGVQSGLGSGSPTGGVYSGPGVTDDGNGMTYSFDPAVAGAGVHSLTYTFTDGNGCMNSASDDIEVFDITVVTFTALADLCIDAGIQSGLGSGTPTGGIYSGTGVTDDGNGMTYSFDPVGAGVGIHTITYTFINSDGCTSSASDDVEVFDIPVVTFTAPADLCVNEGIQAGLGGGTPTGGVYSGPGVTDDGNGMTYTFDPETAGAGTHTFTYTLTDGNGCTSSASDDVEVFGLSIVTFTAPADLCIDAAVQTGLNGGTPPGGIFSGPGVMDDGNGMTYSFDPVAAGVGVHTLTYSFTDANGCTNTSSDDVEVFDLPIVTFTIAMDVCIDAGVQTGLGGGTPTGGTYSGTGVTDDGNGMTYSFDPAIAGVGIHTLTYTYTDGNGCTNSGSDDVEVFDLPSVTFTALGDLCIDAGVQTGLSSGVPTGGVYSGPGVTDDGNGMTYSFDPAVAGVGVHTITYTYNDTNGCAGTFSDDVEVFDLPVVTFTALADLCVDAGVQAGLGGGTPTGGVYSGTGVTDNGNGMDYDFDPGVAGVGVHTLTYTYTDGNGCTNSASDDVEVFDLPVVLFTALTDICVDAGVQAGLGGGTPTGGVYSGTGVTDNGNGMDYDFDPAAAGVGVHTITYTYTDGNGCTNSGSDDVEVFDLPSVTFTALGDLCIDAGVQTGLSSGVPTGGVYSGPGVTDDGNGMTYSFDPAVAGVGVHTITYTYNDTNGCAGTFSDDVEVFDLPVVTFTALADICVDAGVQAGLGGGTPTGGVYSGTGVTDNGNGMDYDFDPGVAGVGVHTLTYTYTDGNGCTNSASDDVEVFDLPVVSFTALTDICVDAGVQAGLGGGTPTGGVYSGTGVTDNGNGMDYDFDPAAAGVGVHTITYTYTDGNGCTNSGSDDVEVVDLPIVDLVTELFHCVDADIQNLPMTGGSPSGGVYSGIGITDNGNGISYLIDPTVNGVGIVTVTYTYTDTNGCTNTATSDIEIADCGVTNSFEIDDPCSCLDNATILDLDAGTGGDDGQFSEEVTITGGSGVPLPNGMTWSIVGASGAFDAFNIPAVGMQSAGVAIPEDGSVLLAFNAGIYEVPFVHVDDIGYTLTIEGPFAMGSAANVTFMISNKCQYPNPVFDPVIPDMINMASPVITLGGTDTNGGTADDVTFTVDGSPATEIDPSALAMGTHTVVMTYDGAADSNGGVSPDGGTTSASPGCIQEVTKDFEIVLCDLVVDCSNVVDMTLACLGDLPPEDLNLPIIIDSCDNVIVTVFTTIPGDTGCPGDELTVTRTYSIDDGVSPTQTCMQTFTIVSTMDPTFTFFPGDTTVLCGAATDPGSTGMATGAGECGNTVTIDFIDVTTPGSCPAEMTITRTWSVTDRCARVVMMDQTIMVVDTIAPTMVCQNITIELDANGMATASVDAVDNGSNDNCGGSVMLSLNTDMFTCANLGANDVWLIGEDECGNIDSCMAVITIEDNLAPIAICQDVTLSLDENGNASIAADGGATMTQYSLGSTVTQLASDVVSTICGPVSTASINCDCPVGYIATGVEGLESTDFGGLVGAYNIICRQLMSNGTLGATSQVTCSNGTANTTTVLGPVATTGDNVLVGAQSRIGCAIDRVSIFSNSMADVIAGASNASAPLEGAIFGSNGGAGGDLRPLRSAPNGSVIVGMQTFTTNNSSGYSGGMAWRYAAVEEITIQLGSGFLINNGSNDNCTEDEDLVFTVTKSEFDCADIPAGQSSVVIEVIMTIADEQGNSSMCTANVTVMDDTPPVVECPSDIFVQLEAGECEEIVFFDIPFTDNCEAMDGTGSPTIEQTEGLPSGSFYPKGTTTNTFIVTDVNGNSTECSFDVTMVEFENGVTGTMACNDNINVSLDMDCEVVLGADMLLEGDVYGCYNDFIIEVSGGVVGNVITEEGTYTVTITDPETGNSCWSTINVEDKQVPTIEDCSCPVGGSEVMTPFVGTLDETDPIWTRPFVAGGVCNPSLTGVNIPYDTYNFSLDMDANLGAEVVTFTAPSGDSFLCLYEDSFDPTDPCGNLVITNDNGGVGLLSQFDVMLNSGVEYILVVTTFNNNGNDFGDYVVEITSEATLLELAEECNFRCVDVEYIFGSDELTPNPTITSCSSYEAFISDELTEDANGNPIILRTWLAVNENGSSTCTQQFNIAPIAIDELRLPINPVLLSCNDGTSPEEIVAIFDNPLTLDNPNTSFVENNEGFVYAYPTYDIDGHPQKVDNQVCDVYAAYTDQELDACGEGCNGNRKVIRTWTLVDWNTLEISTFIQTIKAVDTEAPTLETQDITVSTDAWGCEASFEVPSPWELHDNCDSSPRYSVSGPAGIAIGGSFENGYVAIGVPKGSHTFAYIAYDCCGNEASYPFEVRVVDLSPPVVVAKQNVVISLTSGSTSADGLAKLYAESIDNGSYDGCTSEVRLEVRRDEDNCDVRGNATYNADGHPEDGSPNPNSPSYDPDGGAFVKFCCADLTNAVVDVDGDGELDAGYVKVWLRVWDDGDMDGIYGTAGDNFNEAWAYVKVEDKLAPSIQCPPDVTLTCDMDYTDLNMTGSASAFGSCGSVDVEYNDIIINLNSCNEGFVRRRWSVVNRSDIFCDQTITLEDLDIPVTVSFAQVQDFTAANCPAEIALGEPTWVAGPCDVLGYTLETDTFRFEDGACYKLVNNWTVINWCDYEPNNPFWNGEGLWEHIQIVRVTDETQPVLEDCEDKMYEVNDHSDSDDDGDVCEAKITLTNVASDPGSENCPTGWLKWQVLVDLWGDGTDDLEYSSFLPPFDNQLNDTNGNGIPDMYVSPTANGETVSIPLPDIAGSMSNHKVVWKVTDGCNNVTSCDTEFMVVDKKGPTPYCVNLSTAVMESSGTVELWAIDFNVGSFDNCTAEEDLRYTFTSTPPEDDPNYDEAQYSSSMIFDCGDVENSPVEVNMYVWDEKGNADFCVVFLTLVDNSGACGGKPDIAGKVATEGGLGVEEVEVKLEANLPEYPRLEMTDDSGDYLFEANALNGSYQLSGSKDVDYLNGVSTLDLVKIQRHILGLESLDSPYKLIAADVNGDDDVKASDLTELRKLILGVITDLPTNESWRFVDGEQELSMDMNLADVDYTQEIENLEGNTMSKDFVGVKIGDVTEDASANLASNSTAVVRSNKRLSLSILNQEVVAGQEVSVDFTSEDFESVFGYQFTLELKGLEFVGIEDGAVEMREEHVGVLTENVLTMSYHNTTGLSVTENEEIFTVQFVAKEAGMLSNMLDITSKVTRSEAYVSTSPNGGETLEVRDVVIEVRGGVVEGETTALYQNEPNPFDEITVIGFDLGERAGATLTVFDVTGKVILKKNIDGVKGYNTVNLAAKQLGTSGVLYYTLESGDFTATKKMIVIE